MSRVRLASGLDLSPELFTTASAIVGIRGSGKTTTGVVATENAIRVGVPPAIVDPTGVWWGLKSSADGKEAGLPVYVFGGQHGDVPLEPEAGPVIARFVVDERVPVVLDLSDLTKGRQHRFVGAFCETLYDLKSRRRDPLLVVIDEAARFCPQQTQGRNPDLARCVGAVEDIVALGRSRGLGSIIIGQRPATINKNILTQCDNLFALRTVGTQDRAAIDAWVVEAQGNPEQRNEMVANLASLATGEGYFWSPAIFSMFKRVKFEARTTFDSSRTPKVGEKRIEPRVFASVNLDKLRGEIAGAVERAKADDPKALRARISQLEKQLAERPTAPATATVEVEKIVEKPVLDKADIEKLGTTLQSMSAFGKEQMRIVERVVGALDAASKAVAAAVARPATRVISRQTENAEKLRRPAAPRREASLGDDAPAFRSGARRILQACATFGDRGLTKPQIVALARVKAGGTFSTYLGELTRAGLVEQRGQRFYATGAGFDYLAGDIPEQPTTAREILDHWRGRFRAGAARMLDVIVDAHPRGVSRNDLADRARVEKGGTFSTYLGELKRAELVDEHDGLVHAAIFDLVAR